VEEDVDGYPHRVNPHAILRGAMAAFPEGAIAKV
jgi:hypothetical protein